MTAVFVMNVRYLNNALGTASAIFRMITERVRCWMIIMMKVVPVMIVHMVGVVNMIRASERGAFCILPSEHGPYLLEH